MLFPKWMNALPTVGALGGVGGLVAVIGGFWYYATPKFFDVGYMPKQPGGGYNHQIHAGKLGIDCRYCHSKIEESAEANIPPVQVCYGCHAENHLGLYNESEVHKNKTEFIRTAWHEDQPIEWRRVHKVPDYVRNFPHQAHLRAGVSCYSCHGRIDQMPEVYQHEPLGMGWCLDCHRAPDANLVDPKRITDLQYAEDVITARQNGEGKVGGEEGKANSEKSYNAKALIESLHLNAPQNCGACHY